MTLRPPTSTLFPYTTLFRSSRCLLKVDRPGIVIERNDAACPGIFGVKRVESIPGADVEHRLVRHRSEEHTSELQSLRHLVCRLLLEKKKKNKNSYNKEKH